MLRVFVYVCGSVIACFNSVCICLWWFVACLLGGLFMCFSSLLNRLVCLFTCAFG